MSGQPLLRIAELTVGRVPSVESDPYIPLRIRWAPPALRQGPPPMYVRVSGIAGGELELRIDRASGVLLALTVLSLGAIASEPPTLDHSETCWSGCELVMDKALWERDESVIDLELLLRPYRLPAGIRIDFAGIEPPKVLDCGPSLTVGIDTDGVLAFVAATLSIDEHHFRS